MFWSSTIIVVSSLVLVSYSEGSSIAFNPVRNALLGLANPSNFEGLKQEKEILGKFLARLRFIQIITLDFFSDVAAKLEQEIRESLTDLVDLCLKALEIIEGLQQKTQKDSNTGSGPESRTWLPRPFSSHWIW